MQKRILSFIFVMSLLASLLPTHVYAQTSAEDDRPSLQGEIAYVHDGDIWLLDLFSKESRRLTEDGDNRWPSWSDDGRYLLYTHEKGEEEYDFYIWELDAESKPRLLAEDACCAAWREESERIAYIDLSQTELSIADMHSLGSDADTLLDSLQFEYGGYFWPTGNLGWNEDGAGFWSSDFFLPVELAYDDPFFGWWVGNTVVWGEWNDSTVGGMEYPVGPACFLPRFVRYFSDDVRVEAVEFQGECDFESSKGLSVVAFDETHGQMEAIFPWLSYPSFLPTDEYLVAEQYSPATDPFDAQLLGLTLVDWRNEKQWPLLDRGVQPAWRPVPSLHPAVARVIELGEHAVSLEPSITWQGETYHIHYLADGDFKRNDASLFHTASLSEDPFAKQGINAFIVTRGNSVVTDADLLRDLFQAYAAAYYLYEAPPTDDAPSFSRELDLIIDNPLFVAMSPAKALRTQRQQTEESLRAILTDQVSSQGQLDEWLEQVKQEDPETLEDALDIFQELLAEAARSNPQLEELGQQMTDAFANADKSLEWGGNTLTLFRFLFTLLHTQQLQQERADWLDSYVDGFVDGNGSLDRTQIRAAATVLAEVNSRDAQRANAAVDFVQEEGIGRLLDMAASLSAQKAPEITALVAERSGSGLLSHAAGTAAGTVALGLNVNSLLYGSDAIFASFQTARRAEELRDTFRDGRLAIEATAGDGQVYEGDLATQFRIAWLLERAANAQLQRSYADGVAAVDGRPNLTTLLNWLQGEDWDAIAEELHALADDREAALTNTLGFLPWLEAAVELGLARQAQPHVEQVDANRFRETVTSMTFVRVPTGEFTMGSSEAEIDAAWELCNEYNNGDCERYWFGDETPKHEIHLNEYWIGETEVTNQQYRTFVEAGGYDDPSLWTDEGWEWRRDEGIIEPRCWDHDELNGEDQPVVCVSWYEAMAYAAWLTLETGFEFHLPTEAEWEKAARGDDALIFPWGNDWDGSRLNYCDFSCPWDWADQKVDDGYKRTAPVGSYPDGSAPHGALDMAGNVWEWTGSVYLDYPYIEDDGREEIFGEERRVVRGGAWDGLPSHLRAALRNRLNPGDGNDFLGLRLAASSPGF